MSEQCCSPNEAVPIGENDKPLGFWHIREVQASSASGLLALFGFLAGWNDAPSTLELTFYIGAILIGGYTFVPETIKNLFKGKLGVGTLMFVAGLGAILLGEFGEAASLAFLFSIAEALEGYALAKTRRGLRALLSLVPEIVTVRRNNIESTIAPNELIIGDIMIVRPGERIATDGVIRVGTSFLDLSAITGESMPIEVEPGQTVAAAGINGGGVIEIEVTSTTSDSSLSRIVHIVEEAQDRKGNSQRLAEQFAKPLVPGIMIVAANIAIFGSIFGDSRLWIERSLVVLVAASPCAFAIAVPISVVAAIGSSAKMGALVKGGIALEALSQISVMALDKTGTLTRNKPSVIDIVVADGSNRDEILQVAAALEARSDHPLAAAIMAEVKDIEFSEAKEVQAVIGNGITGKFGNQNARLGKPGFIDAGILQNSVEKLQHEGSTVVLIELDKKLLGAIAVRDELRPEAIEVISSMRKLGMKRIVMLTGDNKRTADSLGKLVGVDEVYSELLPEDKVRIVEDLRKIGPTAMVGDGINDAPALATAEIGMAMGAMGSDVAIEAADVALMGEDLIHLPQILSHARRAGRIMRQNLILSGLILVAMIPLAGIGTLPLGAVVAMHELAEVIVIINGQRLSFPKKASTSS